MAARTERRDGVVFEIVSGPDRHGSERVWRVRLADGRRALLGELLPELAREESVRRRYVRDAERLAALRAPSLAATLALGPAPDPRDPQAAPPWRLRVDPPGPTLEAWLAERAPAPPAETLALGARLCDALAEVHAGGAVVRDLQPRQVVLGDEGRLWLAEIGLARVDLLSTRTASSLILEGSPYASPEHLRGTRVDARSDLYSVGVILYRALTGRLPFGDTPALWRRGEPAPFDPAAVAALVRRLLGERPEERPDSAREVAAALRGEDAGAGAAKALARIACQGCGAAMPAGLRLCLACGKAAVQLVHVAAGAKGARALDLLKAKEAASYLGPLRATLATASEAPLPRLDFLTENVRMYAKEERALFHRLPARLYTDLEPETAERLRAQLAAQGISVEVRDLGADRRGRRNARITLATWPAWIVAAIATLNPLLLIGGAAQLIAGLVWHARKRDPGKKPILRLRQGPTALPAADPLVLALARILEGAHAADVHDQVAELALLVQRLVEHRAVHGGAGAEIDALATPVAPLVALVEKQVRALAGLDRELASLDEGAIVRALAASEARREPRSQREPLLAGLDRLRSLEDLRAGHMQRLLEASTLLRRAVAVALTVEDPEVQIARDVEEAMALLDAEQPEPSP